MTSTEPTPRKRLDPAAKATEALRVAENRLERLKTAHARLLSQCEAAEYRMDATRQHVNYLASNPLLGVTPSFDNGPDQ